MDPAFFSALTVTVVPARRSTCSRRGPLRGAAASMRSSRELRTMVDDARPTDAVFRTNHASNYLPLGGHLPRDRARIVAVIDAALAGEVPASPRVRRGL